MTYLVTEPITEPSGVELAALLDAVDADVLDVLVAPAGIHVRVDSAVLWDPGSAARPTAGALVFAVAVDETSPALVRALEASAGAGAAGLVVRRPGDPSWLRRRAAELEIAVLTVPRGVPWDHALAVTRGTLDAPYRWDGDTGDRFGLADAAAATLGGPVDVTDHGFGLLAFSSVHEDLDELRVRTVLQRRLPADTVSWLRESGELSRLRAARTPILLEPPGDRARAAVPLRAGPELVGYLWLSPEGDLDETTSRAMAYVARSFTAALVRSGGRHTDQRASDTFRGVLDGSATPDALAAVLAPWHGRPFRLIGLRPGDGTPLRHLDGCHVENLVTMRAQAKASTSVTARHGDSLYALVDDVPVGELVALAEDIVTRAANQFGTALTGVVGNPVADLDELPGAAAALDRALRIHALSGGRGVVTADTVRSQCILHELAEFARDRPHLLAGHLQPLCESDATRGTSYLETLQAFFDANCDLSSTARALYVHRNTVRYRLQRIRELCDLDLDDSLERLLTELQLRLSAVAGDLPS